MKVALVTKFPARFVEDSILPELADRGVEVSWVADPKKAEGMDFSKFGLDMVLYMTELSSHAESSVIRKAADRAGVPIRALSRKKASWNGFLPPPRLLPPPPPMPKEINMSNVAKLGDLPGAAQVIQSAKGALEKPKPADPVMQPLVDIAYAIAAHAEAINGLAAAIRESAIREVQKSEKTRPDKTPAYDGAEKKVLEILAKIPNLTAAELYVLVTSSSNGDPIKIESNSLHHILSKMATQARIVRLGTGGKNSPYRYTLP